MFTGIIEERGRVLSLDHGEQDARLRIAAATILTDARHGDSVAVDGVCLTVAEHDGESFVADVMPETLRRSTLGGLRAGDRVNLERAVPVTGRLHGHLVQGHVDGVATLVAREPGQRWDDLTFRFDLALARYVAEKGSITVAGVSLTVTAVAEDGFSVSLIPTTLAETTLGGLVSGDRVNIEVDVLAKYVERLTLAAAGGAR